MLLTNVRVTLLKDRTLIVDVNGVAIFKQEGVDGFEVIDERTTNHGIASGTTPRDNATGEIQSADSGEHIGGPRNDSDRDDRKDKDDSKASGAMPVFRTSIKAGQILEVTVME